MAEVGPQTESFEVRGVRNGSIVTIIWDRGRLDGDPPTVDLVETEAEIVAEARQDPFQRRAGAALAGRPVPGQPVVTEPEAALALILRTLDRVVQVTTPARSLPGA